MTSKPAGDVGGLTLVEVLVVITIVLALVAITQPSIIKAKRSAGKTVCASNLRQLHLSLLLYAADHGDIEGPGLIEISAFPPRVSTLSQFSSLKCVTGRDPIDCGRGGYTVHFPLADRRLYLSQEHFDSVHKIWQEDYARYGESIVLISDSSHQDLCPLTEYALFHSFGITMSGAVIRKSGRGDRMLQSWWH